MAVLKSKSALFAWYTGLKTNLKTNKITVIEFEKEVIDTITAFFEGNKEITPTKADLIADILNAFGYDHLFTKNWSVHLAYVLGNSGATTVDVVRAALENFTSVQVAWYQRKEKEQTVKAETTKPPVNFPSYEELKNWHDNSLPGIGNNQPLSGLLQRTTQVNFTVIGDHFVAKLNGLKQLLDPQNPDYYHHISIIDAFVGLFLSYKFPVPMAALIASVLSDLYTNPAVTPNIDVMVNRVKQQVQPIAEPNVVDQAIQRATAWREDEAKQNHHGNNMLQEFARTYCPVTTARQTAQTQLSEFVSNTAQRILRTISNPSNPENPDLLLKGHAVDVLKVKHGAIGISTTISNNGVVKLRIFAQRVTDESSSGLRAADDRYDPHASRSMNMTTPISALVEGFIGMWDIPNRRPRFEHNNQQYGGAMYGTPTVEEQLLSRIAHEVAQYGITATYGSTEDSIIVVLH